MVAELGTVSRWLDGALGHDTFREPSSRRWLLVEIYPIRIDGERLGAQIVHERLQLCA